MLALLAGSIPAAARAPMTLGVSVPDGRDEAKLQAFIDQMQANGGQKPALWSIWSQWGARGGDGTCDPNEACAFPRAMLDELDSRDITGVVWWEPVIPGKAFPAGVRYGRHKNTFKFKKNDQYIRAWARDALEFGQARGRKVVLRLAHEGNGNFFPWVIGQWDNTNKTFKRFWRYVYNQFDNVCSGGECATDYVQFFWSMNKKRCPGCNPFKVIWPGGKYVDYVGFTAFNWGAYKSWKPMVKILKQPMKQLRFTKKPVIVGELASHFKPTSKSKASWIRWGYKAAYDKWSRLRGILYLNANVSEFGHPDWRLVRPNDGSALQAYADLTDDPRFEGQLP